jgi:long-chain acyl-CoA synthetase
MQKYLKYERIFHPLRFLHTLPLSHVFGQFMGLWIPPLLGAEVHFESRLQAQRLIEITHRERISVLAAVPRVLELMRESLLAQQPELPQTIEAAQGEKVWKRWWRFRKIHRAFGYKFWAFVCGGASLPSELESFWNTLGFALVQGYGMTETAALITLNHPFKVGRGTIGKVLPGRDVEIRDDGEIVVRGDMVSTSTWRNGAMQKSDSPWLATGDLAKRDEEGQLHFLGRKNQVIVTSSGLNIHPEDVEAALSAQAGVEASVVVPLRMPGGDEPVAVLLYRGPRSSACGSGEFGRSWIFRVPQLARCSGVKSRNG